ncbi:MAG: hypothetical protein R3B70_13310 [Polyangiaceae bacterium]
MIAPFFVLLIGFDQIAGDIQHRAIRYIAGRSRRESIVVGKALGVWAVISVMLLVLHIAVWVVMPATGSTSGARSCRGGRGSGCSRWRRWRRSRG